jgi:DNA polymerase-3 subunit epsilon/CBS domain-containing protein
VTRHATADRLAGLTGLAQGGAADLAGLDEDHQLALELILAQQLEDIAEGLPPGNRVVARAITVRQTQGFKAALARQGSLSELLRDALAV